MPIESVRVVFAGTPEFAVPSLQALIDAGVDVTAVLTQPDRPGGRGRRLSESPVKQLALAHRIPLAQPERLTASGPEQLPVAAPDLLVVVAYGLILPEWMLGWPAIAPLNVHASLLPRWRGAAPIQQAILAGDAETGVSIMRIVRGLDAGPVYARASTKIDPDENAQSLHDRLAVLGAKLLLESLPGILSGELPAVPQNDALATYAGKISKQDAVLDWKLPADVLARVVRAYNPWPIAETRTEDGERLRIWEAEAIEHRHETRPGCVVGTGAGIDVATGDGVLRLTRVQAANGRPMLATSYLAARDLGDRCFVGKE